MGEFVGILVCALRGGVTSRNVFKVAGIFITTFRRKRVEDVGVNGGVSGGVSGGVNTLYDYIKQHPGGRVIHLEKALKVPRRTMERWIKQLKDEEKIEFRGSPKKGRVWGKVVRKWFTEKAEKGKLNKPLIIPYLQRG